MQHQGIAETCRPKKGEINVIQEDENVFLTCSFLMMGTQIKKIYFKV